ncbi:MAG: diadenylate cyclase CdaA [Lachnospiraceae bacterium]|nr:diadenylate cyclase CdaA [Lachnospiraceae bacterium]MCR5087004.1 diadenylate cyclase CdaA [Lachnospiraceae bacterium]
MHGLIDAFRNAFNWVSLPKIAVADIVEILLIAFLMYHLINWIQRTRAWYLVKGLIILVLVWFVATIFEFSAILWIFRNAVSVGIIAIFIIFQPELRTALEQLGQRKLVGFFDTGKGTGERFSDETREEIIAAVLAMAEVKTGALIIIEEKVSLDKFVETGIALDSLVTSGLLINIFEHNTPLHDGAVIVRGNRAAAATCILPVSDNMRLSKELGMRHRAGVGVSEVSDCLTIIVSEENGKIALAQHGQLIRDVSENILRSKMTECQNKSTGSRRRFRKEWNNHEGQA